MFLDNTGSNSAARSIQSGWRGHSARTRDPEVWTTNILLRTSNHRKLYKLLCVKFTKTFPSRYIHRYHDLKGFRPRYLATAHFTTWRTNKDWKAVKMLYCRNNKHRKCYVTTCLLRWTWSSDFKGSFISFFSSQNFDGLDWTF